ncbi:hypothetical protein AQ490_07315 [Wenjunlia vitaminophila]|uniref:DUF5722 domain-containing protein n=1 Tax=Wenjunlia vitaminophila TaxID=76728 RepID=A0A0T6LN51_WENVI|nr:DUF5722 domain-containing protein [Wenjunlia vitaminophila]KRV47276.1 hypothetical protein AQ490_07315 [Wenjunlia vitaminophila]
MVQARRRLRPAAGLLALALALPVAWTAAPARADTAPGITSVAADQDTVTITGRSSADEVALYALESWQDAADRATGEPVATVSPGDDGGFTARIARREGQDDHFDDKFLAVADDTVLGTPHYVDDVRFPGITDTPYPHVAGKKGLQVEMTDDAEETGTGHAAVNVALDQVMRAGPNAAQNAVPFTSRGRTYYFDKAAVGSLDSQIKPLSDNGILVNLILILYQNNRPTSAWPELVHPDAEIGKGTVYAFDTKTAEGTGYLTAAMEFLADRYTRADGAHGRASGWIVGNEIDAQRYWYNMGAQSLDDFLEYYARALRITWQSVRKADTNGRVYTSLTHYWTAAVGDDHLREYRGRDVIDGLNRLTKAQGDFPWNLAHHPYPENLFNPAFWNDRTATDSFDSQRITFKNIQVLPRYMARSEQLYQGQPRRIILSEQGLNAQDYSEEALDLQAAAYAYAYYKIAFLDGIDSFILHRHVDHQHEGGLHLGLWTWDDEHGAAAMPGEHKPIYDVYRDIDTVRSLEATEFAKEIIGISDWADVIPGFDPAELAVRSAPDPVGVRHQATPVVERVVSDFTDGTDGWRASDNSSGVSQVDGALRVGFNGSVPGWSRYAKTWKGADLVLDQPLDASTHPQLSVSVRVPADADDRFRPGNTFHAKVRVYGKDGRVAAGTAPLSAQGDFERLTVDLSAWESRSAVSRIKVWVRGSVGDDWNGYFDLDQVSLAAAAVPSPTDHNVDVTARTEGRGEIGSPVTLTVTNHDVAPLAGRLELRACAGVAVDTQDVTLGRLATGQSQTITTRVTAFTPQNPEYPVVCAAYPGGERRVTFRLPPASQQVPPAPDAFANREFNDAFDTDSTGSYRANRVLPEDRALPTLTVQGGTLNASHPTQSWFGTYAGDTSPRSPAFATSVTVRRFQGTSSDMDTVYTGLVRDGTTDVLAYYVNTRKAVGFEVRGPQVPGGIAVFGAKQDVTVPDGGRFALSVVGERAAIYVDSGDGWKLVTATTLDHLPDLSDATVRAQYRYGFGVRGDAGPAAIAVDAVEGRSIA